MRIVAVILGLICGGIVLAEQTGMRSAGAVISLAARLAQAGVTDSKTANLLKSFTNGKCEEYEHRAPVKKIKIEVSEVKCTTTPYRVGRYVCEIKISPDLGAKTLVGLEAQALWATLVDAGVRPNRVSEIHYTIAGKIYIEIDPNEAAQCSSLGMSGHFWPVEWM